MRQALYMRKMQASCFDSCNGQDMKVEENEALSAPRVGARTLGVRQASNPLLASLASRLLNLKPQLCSSLPHLAHSSLVSLCRQINFKSFGFKSFS